MIGWPSELRAEGPRATVAALLAHEVAGVIARADAIDDLTDEAQTDALTGLPNRRTWEAHLTRIGSDGEPLAIAILDLDHFKEFNDTYGHPTGDRLLKETAAAWRDQLRIGDFLARIGGEEFGLVLPNCELETATEVIDRLRRASPTSAPAQRESPPKSLTKAPRAQLPEPTRPSTKPKRKDATASKSQTLPTLHPRA